MGNSQYIVSKDIPEEKLPLLQKSLDAPDDPLHQEVIKKAIDRGWIAQRHMPSMFESVARGAGQGLTLGFQPALSAGLDNAATYVHNKISPDSPIDYSKEEDFKKINDEARAANPKSYLIGDVGGSIAGSIFPTGLYGKVAQGTKYALGTVKGAAVLGGIAGGLRSAGDTEEIFSKKGAQDIATGTGLGAVTGATLQAAANKIVPKNAKKVSSEIKSQTTVPSDTAPPGSSKIQNQPADRNLDITAKVMGKDPKDVVHFSENRERILSQPTLDENGKNPLSQIMSEDFGMISDRLKAREAAAGELIENSKANFKVRDVIKIFQDKIHELKSSGASKTKTTQTAINELEGYVKSFLGDEEFVNVDEVWNAKQMRQFVQGLWKDNKSFYVPGKETMPVEEALGDVAHTLNENVLKKNVNGFAELMDEYSHEVDVFKRFRKLTDTNNWFKNRILKPVQDKLEGVATDKLLHKEQKSWLKTIQDFQDLTGRDYQEIINDQLTFGRLFPEAAQGGQKGSLTTAFGRTLGKLVTGSPVSAAREGAGGLVEFGQRSVGDELLSGTSGIASKLTKGAVQAPGVVKAATKEGGDAVRGFLGKVTEGSARIIPMTGRPKIQVDINWEPKKKERKK